MHHSSREVHQSCLISIVIFIMMNDYSSSPVISRIDVQLQYHVTGYYVAYEPITIPCILFMFIEIHSLSFMYDVCNEVHEYMQ